MPHYRNQFALDIIKKLAKLWPAIGILGSLCPYARVFLSFYRTIKKWTNDLLHAIFLPYGKNEVLYYGQ